MPYSHLAKYVPLLRTFTLEPFVFIFMLSMTVKGVAIVQLYEDKLCAVDYGYDVRFCKELFSNDSVALFRKSQVLGDSGVYQVYQALITTIPITICSLFIGCWIDSYKKSTKLLLTLAAIGGICESLFLVLNSYCFQWPTFLVLVSFIPTALTGSNVYMLMAAFSYIPKSTPEKFRSIRFATMDFAIFFGTPIGLYLVGKVLHMHPIGNHSMHNHIGVFMIVLFCNVLCLMWVLVVFKEVDSESTEHTVNAEPEGELSALTALLHIFKWKNVMETLNTCLKERQNYGRIKLWILISAIYIVIMAQFGQVNVLFQFTERVFGWDVEKFSTVNAIGSIASNVTQAVFVIILVKRFHVKDISLAIIGSVSLISQILLRGFILQPLSLYISFVVGGVNGMATIGIRSFISRLVERTELGKVFCVMGALESTQPLTSNLLTAYLFKTTVEETPGFVFKILALATIYSVIVTIIIEVLSSRNSVYHKPLVNMEERKSKKKHDKPNDLV